MVRKVGLTPRERVAERQRLEAASIRGAPKTPVDARRTRAAVLWKRVATVGNVVQWLAMLSLLVEVYSMWTAAPGVGANWNRILVFAVILGGARLVKIAGTMQFKRYR
jgi:hypothetical protein